MFSKLLGEFHSVYFALIGAVVFLVLLTHWQGANALFKTGFRGVTDPLFIIQGKTPPGYGK